MPFLHIKQPLTESQRKNYGKLAFCKIFSFFITVKRKNEAVWLKKIKKTMRLLL